MNPFEMVVAIMLIVTVGTVLKAKYGLHDRRGRRRAQEDAAFGNEAVEQENRDLKRELRAMQERLAVLERLATEDNDSTARLDREIERLRDTPRPGREVARPQDQN